MAFVPIGFRPQASQLARAAQSGLPQTQPRQFPGPAPALRTASMFSLPKEPEDARLTGGTRSLDRRLLALNLHTAFAKAKPVRPAPAPGRMAAPLRTSAA